MKTIVEDKRRGQRGGAKAKGHVSRADKKTAPGLAGGHVGLGGQRTCVRPLRVSKSGSCRDVTQGAGNAAAGRK